MQARVRVASSGIFSSAGNAAYRFALAGMTHAAPVLSLAQRGLIGSAIGASFLLGLLADRPQVLPVMILSGALCAAPFALWGKASGIQRRATNR